MDSLLIANLYPVPSIDYPIIGLYSQLTSDNPTPRLLQQVTEYDTGRVKFGDGITAYNSLTYNLQPLKEIALSSGAINGVNTTFVWTEVPLQVYWNGQLLREGVGYTLTVATKTTVFTSPPFAGESIWANGMIILNQ